MNLDRDAVRLRASLLERHKVPRAWSLCTAQVWCELDVAGDGRFEFDAEAIDSVAAQLGKERRAILRAVAYLTIAARDGLKLPASDAADGEEGRASERLGR